MKRSEECACGAKLEIELPTDIAGYGAWFDRLTKEFKTWRKKHHHEMPEAESEMPFISDSSSSHERAWAYVGEELRAH